jgi:DNA-binding response OmpR family regulator
MTARAHDTSAVGILHIGKADTKHERLWEQLQSDGVNMLFARTQTAGLQAATDQQPQIVVINLANSHLSGDRLCRTLGRRLPNAQRLLITDMDAGQNTPCELHLIRPFTLHKLRESVSTLLAKAAPHILRVGGIQLDQISRVVSGPQGRQRLTPKENDLLAFLLGRPNQVISRRELMEQVWQTTYLDDTRTLDVHIRWLREKIEAEPARPVHLLTRRGIGYLFAAREAVRCAEEEGD